MKPLDPQTFAAALKMHRERCDLTQGEAAIRLGQTSYRTWQNWERGVRTPAPWEQALILRALARWKR